ncbi:hypothetical protein LTS10_012555 [Elasticomyces elasticus]|nr:hypothetical protein LTS10_012555 [Elasticomyces elasticus]
MASARVYLDYISAEEDAAPRRAPSRNRGPSSAGSPRTVVADLTPTQGRVSRQHDQGIPETPEDEDEDAFLAQIGVARTRSDESVQVTALPQYGGRVVGFSGIGVASTTDSRRSSFGADGTMTLTTEATSTTSYDDDEVREPVLDEQMHLHALNNPMTPRFGPVTAHQLLKFGQSRLCGENMEFLTRVNRYNALLEEVSKTIYEIHKDFISTSAPAQINIPEHLLTKVNSQMKTSLTTTMPALEGVFVDAQADIERLVYTDIYPNFVRHQMSVSAARALGTDRSKYAGLGDCFVLTDPSKADNPIVYASDGFVKVTGYARNEIIPRNCRFLQSRHTDRAAVRRLKNAIDKREESVELLLNIKKNGEPFWNLLYVTPLYDAHGNLAFFLGGQINCSTTIHNASDVLRILGASNEKTDDPVPGTFSPLLSAPPPKPPRARSFLNAIRGNPRVQMRPMATPGMENKLVEKLEDMSLKNQMDTFYTAYSNYFLINFSTFLVSFISPGIADLLFPIKAKKAYHAQAIGNDIFKFLGNHASGSLSWEFKNSVKGALKMGQAISLELKLCARPLMAIEKFLLHWTPLKDEMGAVTWIVLTLGNEQRA